MSVSLNLNDDCTAMLSGDQGPAARRGGVAEASRLSTAAEAIIMRTGNAFASLQHAERTSFTPAGQITT